jgi:hypothetical protein
MAAAQGVTVVPDAAPEQLALAASRAWWVRAPVVVVAPVTDVQAQLRAASIAMTVGAPVLLASPPAAGPNARSDLVGELGRLGAVQILTVGIADSADLGAPRTLPPVLALPGDAPGLARALSAATGLVTPVSPGGELAAVIGLDPTAPALLGDGPSLAPAPAPSPTPSPTPSEPATAVPSVPLPDLVTPTPTPSPTATATRPVVDPARAVIAFERASRPAAAVVLTDGNPTQMVAIATARAAGVGVQLVPGGDPRTLPAVIGALAAAKAGTVVVMGSAFGTQEQLAQRVAVARTGVQLPGGGQTIATGKRYVALYGTPGTPSLGVLGEQDAPATIARAEAMAAPFRSLTSAIVVPTVEIIATVAAGAPGPDGTFSKERSVADLRPLVDAAHDAGQYVVLDLQSGRTDFLTQAQQYAELLALPNVGLALDPEWRLAPDQVPLRQIGSVSIEEVNAVVAWLADFSRTRALPQKLLVLHEFSSRIIVGIDRLDTSHDELALMVHVDGQGTQPAKAGTWAALRAAAPNVPLWGWKNFIDEDLPMLDPTQTYQVQPTPDLVTYQ